LRRNALDTASKFGSRTTGESQEKDAARIGAVDDQMGDAVRQSFGLARARASDHEQGCWIVVGDAVLYSIALLSI
jgi:hypothetical protein